MRFKKLEVKYHEKENNSLQFYNDYNPDFDNDSMWTEIRRK